MSGTSIFIENSHWRAFLMKVPKFFSQYEFLVSRYGEPGSTIKLKRYYKANLAL